jgi:hypothetical protein
MGLAPYYWLLFLVVVFLCALIPWNVRGEITIYTEPPRRDKND